LNDNAMSALPRIYIEWEAETIKLGIMQRGMAQALFLRDHYSGEKRYLKGRVIPKYVIDNIVERTGVAEFEGRIDPDRISFPNFMYGADVFRAADGSFRVYEDNEGFLGGLGDLEKARETLFKLIPEYREVLDPIDNPSEFYDELAEHFHERAAQNNGIAVLVSLPMSQQVDNEELRLRELFKKRGIPFVSTGSGRTLVRKSDGLYLKYPHGKEVRVGYLFLAAEHHDVDSSNPEAFKKNLIQYAHEHIELYETMLKPTPAGLEGEDRAFWHWGQDIPKDVKLRMIKRLRFGLTKHQWTGEPDWDLLRLIMTNESQVRLDISEDRLEMFKGITDAILDGVVESSFSPGLEIVDDKEFYLYVEKFIRFYLDQEPILKNIEGGVFYSRKSNGKIVLNEKIFQKLLDNYKNYVIKPVGGRGGEGITIGQMVSKSEFRAALEGVKSNFREFKWEVYEPPSIHGNDIGDIRWFSFFSPKNVIVAPTGWLRGSDKDGSGKVNISEDGMEVAAIVVRDLIGGCKGVRLSQRLIRQELMKFLK